MSTAGTFSGSVPTTTWTAPNEAWFFSFDVSDTPAVSNTDVQGFDVVFSNFTYDLAGVTVPTTPVRVRFFAAAFAGLLSVNFQDTTPDDFPTIGFVFSGSQAFSGSTSAPTILPGSYQVTQGSFYYPTGVSPCSVGIPCPVQDLTGDTVAIRVDAAAVPEPGTAGAVIAALLLFGSALRRRNR